LSTRNRFPDRNRDVQDGIERHVYDHIEWVDGAGAVVKVKGTGTEDEEAVVINLGGVGVMYPKGTNAEVHLVTDGSDTSIKYALITIPNDKQHRWKEGQSGIQKWDDPTKRLQFGLVRTWLAEANQAVGKKGNFEATSDGEVTYIRGKIIRSEVPIQVGTPPFQPEE
jgi:hypothetical protein